MYNNKNISSDTSDPSTAHMRVFVGNINTSAITKTCLQEIFCKYGNVTGISIHRGYAFIQYNSVEAAQIAAQSQHQQRITNQIAGFYIHLLLLVTNFLIKTSKLPLNLGRNLFQPYQHRLLSLLLSRLLLIAIL